MRIAVFHNLLSGGNKRLLHETVRGMKSYGHSVDVYKLNISNDDFASLEGLPDRAITYDVMRLHLPGVLRPLIPFVQLVQLVSIRRAHKAIAKAIDGGGYDLAWVCNCYITQHPIVLRYLHTPHILCTAEANRYVYDKIFWKRIGEPFSYRRLLLSLYRSFLSVPFSINSRIDKTNINKAQHILANSDHTRENILRHYGRNSKTTYPGVDIEKYYWKELPKEHLILSVGGLSILKGHDFVLQSLVQIPKAARPRLVIIADREDSTSEKGRIEEFALRHDLDVIVLQNISDIEVVDFYNRAKLTVCANLLEPFGLVPLESMACGTPVVAVREGGFRETVLHETTGLLIERNVNAFGKAIEYLLTNDAVRSTMGENGIEHVRNNFSIKIYWSKVEKQTQAVSRTNELDYTPSVRGETTEVVRGLERRERGALMGHETA